MNHSVVSSQTPSDSAGRASSLLFWVVRQFIAKGLLVALLAAIGTLSSVQPTIALTVAQAREAAATVKNAIAEQLIGQWQAKDPTSDKVFTFIFAPDGYLFVILPAEDGSSVAMKVAYRINTTTQPMQLDIRLSPEQTALTIFELTAEGKLRLDLDGLAPGKPRPTAFRANATLFDKTSEATTVPDNIQVIDVAAIEEAQKPENEAKNYMVALTQVQQARYQEAGEFAKTIEEVSLGLRTETESYRYQFVPQPEDARSIMITATPKKSELPSYTGVVFVAEVNGETTTVAQICESERPSTSPPTMPKPPAAGSSEVQCPAGSRSLQ